MSYHVSMTVRMAICWNEKRTNQSGTNDRLFDLRAFPDRDIWMDHKDGRFCFSLHRKEAWAHREPSNDRRTLGSYFRGLPPVGMSDWSVSLELDGPDAPYLYVDLPSRRCGECGRPYDEHLSNG